MTLLSCSNIYCPLSYCALRTMGSLEAVVLIWTVNREQYLVAPLKLELKLSVRAGFKYRRLPKAANYWERAAMALLLFCFQVFNPEIAAVPALNVDNPLLREKSGNMSSMHCYKGYPLSFLSIIPFPLISCPMPIRGKVNLILQEGVLHLLPLCFFGTLLFFLLELSMLTGVTQSQALLLEEAKREDLTWVCRQVWFEIPVCCLALGDRNYYPLSSLNIQIASFMQLYA